MVPDKGMDLVCPTVETRGIGMIQVVISHPLVMEGAIGMIQVIINYPPVMEGAIGTKEMMEEIGIKETTGVKETMEVMEATGMTGDTANVITIGLSSSMKKAKMWIGVHVIQIWATIGIMVNEGVHSWGIGAWLVPIRMLRCHFHSLLVSWFDSSSVFSGLDATTKGAGGDS